MSAKHPACVSIEMDLVAAATGEAGASEASRVREHIGSCTSCRREFESYQTVDRMVGLVRKAAEPPGLAGARERLESRLADLRRRLLVYRIFDDARLGRVLIARSEEGVSLIEYLREGAGVRASRLAALGVEAIEDGAEVEALYRDLRAYLSGEATQLAWPLDLRLAASPFHRAVLEATAAVPYGAVTSYARIATGIGHPTAMRAVAQALRHNPLPIVIPCHRVVGSSGALTGYAGRKVGLKQRLLTVEGVPTARAHRDLAVQRERMYVRDRDDREYCLPTCGSLSTRTLASLTLFGSREHAEAAGLGPCTTCRPDLHPMET
jgi:methylated-DNA-[protein]-cysteine S-methyltransferase